jgi:hypothetical protein
VIKGQAAGEPQARKMGLYEPLSWTINQRLVYQEGGRDRYLFYADSGEWCVGKRASAEQQTAAGWLVVESDALRPDGIEVREWLAYNEATKQWEKVCR